MVAVRTALTGVRTRSSNGVAGATSVMAGQSLKKKAFQHASLEKASNQILPQDVMFCEHYSIGKDQRQSSTAPQPMRHSTERSRWQTPFDKVAKMYVAMCSAVRACSSTDWAVEIQFFPGIFRGRHDVSSSAQDRAKMLENGLFSTGEKEKILIPFAPSMRVARKFCKRNLISAASRHIFLRLLCARPVLGAQ